MYIYLYFNLFFITIISLIFIQNLIKLSVAKKLFDSPLQARKVHLIATPNIGGVALFFIFILTISLNFKHINNPENLFSIIATTTLIFLFGLKDDLIGLSSIYRLFSQILAGLIITYFGDFRIFELFGFFGIHQLDYVSSIILSIFFFVLITNSFNLIDGINGLAGSLSLLSSVTFATFYFISNDISSLFIVCPIIGGLIGFLFFNINRAKIFMGSSGSYFIGVMSYIFAIMFHQKSIININDVSKFGIISSILFIPIFDTTRVFILRILNKKNPFLADKIHIHHLLFNINNSHNTTLFILVFFNLIVILINIFLKNIGSLMLILLNMFLFLIFVITATFYQKKPHKKNN
jgi:UDP-GlcNAc:undecaprenyl-phosphate GlcNAc-1-phosphate transferase